MQSGIFPGRIFLPAELPCCGAAKPSGGFDTGNMQPFTNPRHRKNVNGLIALLTGAENVVDRAHVLSASPSFLSGLLVYLLLVSQPETFALQDRQKARGFNLRD